MFLIAGPMIPGAFVAVRSTTVSRAQMYVAITDLSFSTEGRVVPYSESQALDLSWSLEFLVNHGKICGRLFPE
jgi:hypothetical protein